MKSYDSDWSTHYCNGELIRYFDGFPTVHLDAFKRVSNELEALKVNPLILVDSVAAGQQRKDQQEVWDLRNILLNAGWEFNLNAPVQWKLPVNKVVTKLYKEATREDQFGKVQTLYRMLNQAVNKVEKLESKLTTLNDMRERWNELVDERDALKSHKEVLQGERDRLVCQLNEARTERDAARDELPPYCTVGEMANHIAVLKAKLTDEKKRQSYWKDLNYRARAKLAKIWQVVS